LKPVTNAEDASIPQILYKSKEAFGDVVKFQFKPPLVVSQTFSPCSAYPDNTIIYS